MSYADEQDVQKIAEDIASYLSNHRQAADTLEGIIKWWLLRQQIQLVSGQVQKAVDYLCEQGVIKPLNLQGRETLYVAVDPIANNKTGQD